MDIESHINKIIESKGDVNDWLGLIQELKSRYIDQDLLMQIHSIAINNLKKEPTVGYKKLLIGLADLQSKFSFKLANETYLDAKALDLYCAVVRVFYAQFQYANQDKHKARQIIVTAKKTGCAPKYLLRKAFKNLKEDKASLFFDIDDPWDASLYDTTADGQTKTDTDFHQSEKKAKEGCHGGKNVHFDVSMKTESKQGSITGPIRGSSFSKKNKYLPNSSIMTTPRRNTYVEPNTMPSRLFSDSKPQRRGVGMSPFTVDYSPLVKGDFCFDAADSWVFADIFSDKKCDFVTPIKNLSRSSSNLSNGSSNADSGCSMTSNTRDSPFAKMRKIRKSISSPSLLQINKLIDENCNEKEKSLNVDIPDRCSVNDDVIVDIDDKSPCINRSLANSIPKKACIDISNTENIIDRSTNDLQKSSEVNIQGNISLTELDDSAFKESSANDKTDIDVNSMNKEQKQNNAYINKENIAPKEEINGKSADSFAEKDSPVILNEIDSENEKRNLASQVGNCLAKLEKHGFCMSQSKDKAERLYFMKGKRYKEVKVLGSGGSCKVYEVISDIGEVFALKKVDLNDSDEIAITMYKNEIKWLEKMKGDKHIIKLYEWEIIGDCLFILLEKGDCDLATVLRNSKDLSKADVKKYWKQMLTAVNTIHKHGIVHADLKPANFLCVGDMLKLIDFGIASGIQDNRTSVTRESQMGTLNYMPPELLKEKNDAYRISKSSDVWSLGCILYSMVYKKTPYSHIRNQVLKIMALLEEKTIVYKRIDDPLLMNCLQGCLKHKKNDRYTITELLDHPYLS